MTRPLRIAVDARVLGQRGVGRYLANLLNASARLPHPHEFLLYLGPSSRKELVPQDPRYRVRDLPGGHPAIAEQWALPRAARREACDLLFYPDNSGAVRPGMPMVLTLHDTMWMRPVGEAIARPTLRQRIQALYRQWVCPAAARAASRVVTISKHSAGCLDVALGLRPPKLSVAYEAADPAFAKALPPAKAVALRQRLGVGAKPYVLASGAADRRKNIDRLIEAFALASRKDKALARAELLVISLRAGEAATTTYAATAARVGVADRVRFLGYVSDDEMKALYQGALCFAFPSLWEGFGLPVLEAFQMGCPVLAHRGSALPETAGTAGVLVDASQTAALALGLSQACDPTWRSRRVVAGRRQAARFSWKACAQIHLKAFESALP